MDAIIGAKIRKLEKKVDLVGGFNDRLANLEGQTALMVQKYVQDFSSAMDIDASTTAIVGSGKATMPQGTAMVENFDDASRIDSALSNGYVVSGGKLTMPLDNFSGNVNLKTLNVSGTTDVILNAVESKPVANTYGTPVEVGQVSDDTQSVPWVTSLQTTTGKIFQTHMGLKKTASYSVFMYAYYRVLNPDGTVLKPWTLIHTSTNMLNNSATISAIRTAEIVEDNLGNVYLIFPFSKEYGSLLSFYVNKMDSVGTSIVSGVFDPHYAGSFSNTDYSYKCSACIDSLNRLVLHVACWAYAPSFNVIFTEGLTTATATNTMSNSQACYNTYIFKDVANGLRAVNYQPGIKTFYVMNIATNGATTAYSNFVINSSETFLSMIYDRNLDKLIIFTFDSTTLYARFYDLNTKTFNALPMVTTVVSKMISDTTNYYSYYKPTEISPGVYVVPYRSTRTVTTTGSELRYSTLDSVNKVFTESDKLMANKVAVQFICPSVFKINGNMTFSILEYETKKIYMTTATAIQTGITYQISGDDGVTWKTVNLGLTKNVSMVPVTRLRIRITMSSPDGTTFPYVDSLTLQQWDANNIDSQSYSCILVLKNISTISTDGTGKLLVDDSKYSGDIQYFYSEDSGNTYKAITPGADFSVTSLATDIRIKALMTNVTGVQTKPEIRRMELRTSSVVMQSNMDTLSLNLLKTNFKIDTFTYASKNGLSKMTIDVFSDTNGIDALLSSYQFDMTNKLVYGGYITTVTDTISTTTSRLLLTSDEILGSGYVDYYASRDGGSSWKKIIPNIQNDISSLGTGTQLKVKAVMVNGAKLNAIGYAWN